MLKRVGESRHHCRTPIICSSEPVSCAANEQDCTLGIVIQIFNDLYDVGVDVVAHKASCHTLLKAVLKSMKT